MDKMYSKLDFCLLLVFLCAVVSVHGQNVSRCNFCEETDEICKDPVNPTNLPTIQCSDLFYPSSRSGQAAPIPGSLSAQIQSIYQQDVESRSGIVTDNTNITFRCVKITVTPDNGTAGTLRSCVIEGEGIRSACEFIQEELPSNYTFNYCGTCDSDNCNSADGLFASVFVGLLSVVLSVSVFK